MTPGEFYDTNSVLQTVGASIVAVASFLPILWLSTYWFRLARHFPNRKKPKEGNWFRGREGHLGPWLNYYNGVINICITEEGVFFEVLFLFRLGHPPFFVPWEKILQVYRWEVMGRNWIKFEIDIGEYRKRSVSVCLGSPKRRRKGKGPKLILKPRPAAAWPSRP